MAEGSIKADKGKKRTLVMFSGGIDSTAALWHVLHNADTYGQIHVHHIHIQNIEARWKAEAVAVKKVLSYMRKHAPAEFSISESVINTPHFGGHFLYDAEVTGFIAGYMTSRDPLIKKVIIGATGSDFARGVDGAVARGKAVHNAFHPNEKDHSGTVKEFPLSGLTKEEAYKTLPPELAALTWSCRRPRYVDGKPVECGTCKTCTLELPEIRQPKPSVKRKST